MTDKIQKYFAVLQSASYSAEFKDLAAEQLLQFCDPLKSPQATRNYLNLAAELLKEPVVGQFKRQYLNLLKGIFRHYSSSRAKLVESFVLAMAEDRKGEFDDYLALPQGKNCHNSSFSYYNLKIGTSPQCTKLSLVEKGQMKILDIIGNCKPLLGAREDEEEGKDCKEVKKRRGRSSKKAKAAQLTISEYMASLESFHPPIAVPKDFPLEAKVKRKKLEKGAEDNTSRDILVEDYFLSIYFCLLKRLLNENWYTRNIAAVIIKELLLHVGNQTTFAMQHLVHLEIANGTVTANYIKALPYDSETALALKHDLNIRILAGMIGDQFTDFLENTASAPVRETFGKLLALTLAQCIDSYEDIVGDTGKIVTNRSLKWMARYNAVLIVKYFMKVWKKTEALGKYFAALKESLLAGLGSEEEIRVVVSKLLKKSRQLVCKDKEFYIEVVKAIFANIKESDDIECSAIDMLVLLEALFQENLELVVVAIRFIDLKLIFVFACHRLKEIRLKAFSLLFRLIEQLFKTVAVDTIKEENPEIVPNLLSLLDISVQAAAMEPSHDLLKVVVKGFGYVATLIDPPTLSSWYMKKKRFFQDLLSLRKITDFTSFTFFQTEEYTPTTTYYTFISEPIDQSEVLRAFHTKTYYLTKVYALMSMKNNEILSDIIKAYGLKAIPKKGVVISDTLRTTGYLLYWLSKEAKLTWIYDWADQMLNREDFVGRISEHVDLPQLNTLVDAAQKFAFTFPTYEFVTRLALIDVQKDYTNNLDQCIDAIKSLYQEQKQQGINSCELAAFYLACTKLQQSVAKQKENVKALNSATLVAVVRSGRELPERLNPVIKPLTIAIKNENAEYLLKVTGKAIAELQWLNAKNADMNKKISSIVFDVYFEGTPCNEYITQYVKRYVKLHGATAFEANKESLLKCSLKNLEDSFAGFLKTSSQRISLELSLLAHTLACTTEQHAKFVRAAFEALLHFIGILGEDVDAAVRFAADAKCVAEGRSKAESKGKAAADVKMLDARALLETRKSELVQIEELVNSLLQQLVKMLKTDSYEKITLAFMKVIGEKRFCGCRIFSRFLTSLPKDYMVYLPYYILPTIRNFSANCPELSELSYQVFSNILKILPMGDTALFTGVPRLTSSADAAKIEVEGLEGVQFLKSFLATEQVYDYKLGIELKEKLREYQVAGISWMAFMHRYNINCALCDDMGLGKTIQALVLVANEMRLLGKALPSLVICPTTLMKNWAYEIPKFFDERTLTGKIYSGNSTRRGFFSDSSIIITSYERVRANIEELKKHDFFYIILDEAHIIRNSKAKVTQAVKTLKGQRKLILSGSPLHNNVTELWSLFDFLNPGFLGSEALFEQTYTKHLVTNLKKINEKTSESTEFTGALEGLKQRIAPFILRRTKQDALKDLPPKIIQDYNCNTSPMQTLLLAEMDQRHSLDCKPEQGDNELMLERIQWHLYLANDPKLLIKRSLERSRPIISEELMARLKQEYKVSDWKKLGMEHSGKMMNLKQLLIECGILTTSMLRNSEQANEMSEASANVLDLIESQSSHRALIFCQKVSMLDIIEETFLKLYPALKYVRLDSRVPAENRVDLAHQFNGDESISLMLLTTKVGGYGLTLTGADTVIFFDHDWNPMNDLQAMDRTHRIGQKKTVNVYRLILLGSIEERVMNIQKFKQNLAKSLIENERTTSDKLKLQEMFESFAEKGDTSNTKKKPAKMSYIDEVAMNWAQLDNGDDLG